MEHYSITVFWSEEDNEFVATCAEFDLLSWLAPTRAEALAGFEALLEGVISRRTQAGVPLPQPMVPA